MPAKTLYVKDEQLWERAKGLAGSQKFSGVIMKLLAQWVETDEKRQSYLNSKEFREIELWVGGNTASADLPDDQIREDHRIVFTGRLLGSSPRYEDFSIPDLKIFEMKSGRLVVYKAYRDYAIAPDQVERATYKVFSNFEDLQQSSVFSDYGKVLDENWEGLGRELSTLAREDEAKFVEKMVAINLQFKRDIANALEAELVIRID